MKTHCYLCEADAELLCCAWRLFQYRDDRASWLQLRSFVVPNSGRYIGRTVWQLVADLNDKYRPESSTPNVLDVRAALTIAEVTHGTP